MMILWHDKLTKLFIFLSNLTVITIVFITIFNKILRNAIQNCPDCLAPVLFS